METLVVHMFDLKLLILIFLRKLATLFEGRPGRRGQVGHLGPRRSKVREDAKKNIDAEGGGAGGGNISYFSFR